MARAHERDVLQGLDHDPAPGDLALRAARWRMGLGMRVSLEDVRGIAAKRPEDAARASLHMARRARAAWAVDETTRWIDEAARAGLPDSILSCQHAWRDWIAGRPIGVFDAPEDAEGRVEAMTLRALAAGESGEVDSALTLARQGFRMARAEELGPLEMLAALVLARARRVAGQAPLSLQIATTVLTKAPPHWAQWSRWEQRLAQGNTDEHVQHVLLGKSLPPDVPPRVRADLQLLAELVRGEHAWNRGETHDAPGGLGPILSGGEDVRGFVRLDSGQLRRVPASWVRVHSVSSLPSPSQARVDGLLCAIAEAGGAPIDEDLVFERAYGFANPDGRYDGTLNVAVHRARDRLGAHGVLERAEGRLALKTDVAIPDPRTRLPPDAALLKQLATAGASSARELATELDVPLRSVQRMLKSMAQAGACRSRGRGKATSYVMEDTTFSEPTEAARWRS